MGIVYLAPMAEAKTKKNQASVADYVANIDEKRRADCQEIVGIMQELAGAKPAMWGASIVGFGGYRYKYASGREGEWPRVGFSAGKTAITLYIMAGFEAYDEIMERLGKYKTGKSCLYIKRLADVDVEVLRELIAASLVYMREKYPEDA